MEDVPHTCANTSPLNLKMKYRDELFSPVDIKTIDTKKAPLLLELTNLLPTVLKP